MSYEVGDQELRSMVSLPAINRMQYFLAKVADWEELWSVTDCGGWSLMATDDGAAAVPVWPARVYASINCVGDWRDREPANIPLDDWMTKWTPGTEADGKVAAVFPLPDGKGVVIRPKDLEQHLRKYILMYG
jgi:hypothetical protein